MPAVAAQRHAAGSEQRLLTSESVRSRAGSVDFTNFLAPKALSPDQVKSSATDILERIKQRLGPVPTEGRHSLFFSYNVGAQLIYGDISVEDGVYRHILAFKRISPKAILAMESYPEGGAGETFMDFEIRLQDETFQPEMERLISANVNAAEPLEFAGDLSSREAAMLNVEERTTEVGTIIVDQHGQISSAQIIEPMALIDPNLRPFFGINPKRISENGNRTGLETVLIGVPFSTDTISGDANFAVPASFAAAVYST